MNQDERYSSEETTYDWYQDYTTLKPYIEPYLRNAPDYEILVAGCGNSSKKIFREQLNFPLIIFVFFLFLRFFVALGADIYDAGYLNITNIDISTVVIAQMSDLYSNRDEMECKEFYSFLLMRNIVHFDYSYGDGCPKNGICA